MSDDSIHSYCGHHTFNSDIVIIAVGAFFKPFYLSKDASSYEKDLESKSKLLFANSKTYREALKRHSKKVRVIWRLFPHVGLHDYRVNAWFSNHTNSSLKKPPFLHEHRVIMIISLCFV